jgi:ABC-type Fe3+-hydroxamate transport system substrate-binding protein
LLLLHADVVIAWEGTAQMAKEMKYPGVIGLFWASNQYFPIGDRETIWRTLGRVTGREAKVEYILNKWTALRAALRPSIPPDPSHQARVAWLRLNKGSWSTIPGPQWQPYRADLVGARTVGYAQRYDLEELLRADPDVILFERDRDDPTTIDEIAHLPEFQPLRAVREKRYYKIPVHAASNEPFEDLTLLPWLAEILYPDIKLPPLRDEYKQQYRDVYRYAIGDDEIDRRLDLKENGQSAGYERFSRQAGMH